VGSFPGARSGDADGLDEVRFGSSRPPGHGRPGWLLIAAAGAAVIAVIAVVVAVALSGHKHKPSVTSIARPTVRPAPPVVLPTAPVTQAGHRLLGVTAGWELLGYGPGQVVRIEFARGRIERTAVPALLSSGPLSFVAGPSQVIIRPLDFVPGYLVPDGHPARSLSGVLSHGGTLIPGPRPGTAWYQSGYQAGSLWLVRMDGTRTGTSLRLPGHGGAQVIPDGRGYALAVGVRTGELYDVGPQGIRRFAGTLAAVGPASWLIVPCRDHRYCSDVVVNSATGARRVLPGRAAGPAAAPPVIGAPGVIAPDGSAAALLRAGRGGQVTLHLLNLVNGRDHRIDVTLDQGSAGARTLAWSPDSRWLFVVAANGTLAAVNARTQHIENIGAKIPSVSQIAIRNSPPASQ
jgi:hypothetical protein